MKEDDGSNRYSATNEIMNPDHAADVGIFEPPTTGARPRGKKPKGGGTSQSNIYKIQHVARVPPKVKVAAPTNP
ncbi:unnamed protein product [Prunus armeniaca]|uniref:Uncharacterized protein n=1 Tax=Prunus armeniaca TaxID=36596 RepID=A0A6J5TLV0_PRUAR|nr:unnamed protein product [Prunus armeniaca]